MKKKYTQRNIDEVRKKIKKKKKDRQIANKKEEEYKQVVEKNKNE